MENIENPYVASESSDDEENVESRVFTTVHEFMR